MYNQGDPGHGNREKWYYPLMDGGPPMHGCPLIVTAGVVREGDAVLIARRTSGTLAGQWEFPGGKLEPGESPEACLARELREELGIEVEVGEIFAVTYHEYPDGPVLLLAYTCRLREVPGCQGIGSGPARAPSRWVRICDLRRYAFAPADVPIVEKLQEVGSQASRNPSPGMSNPSTVMPPRHRGRTRV